MMREIANAKSGGWFGQKTSSILNVDKVDEKPAEEEKTEINS